MRSEEYALKRKCAKWWMISVSLIVCHLSFGVSACSSIDCPVQNTVAVNYGVYGSDGTTAFADTLWVWTQRSDGTDTLLLNRFTGKETFSLPISYSHPEDVLVFFTANTEDYETLDTVWLKKDDIPHFESVDCAAHFFHRLTDVRCTHDGIDSIVINHSSVTYDPSKTHLRVYFKSSK
jgi:hypothetical protein